MFPSPFGLMIVFACISCIDLWKYTLTHSLTLAHIFFKKLAIILRQDFLRTLYSLLICFRLEANGMS